MLLGKLGTDLFEYKKKSYLLVIDYYSRWIDIKQLTSTTSLSVISILKYLFMTFGIPDLVISDNGPQYSGAVFKEFACDWGFHHRTTNPYCHQENGMAEQGIQTVKQILKLKDPVLGLLNYRSTVHSAIGDTPADALMGRQIRNGLPTLNRKLIPHVPDRDMMRRWDQAAKQSYKIHYNSRNGVKSLPVVDSGLQVLVKLDNQKEWSNPSEVIKGDLQNRSYIVKTESGNMRRNRKHLQEIPDNDL